MTVSRPASSHRFDVFGRSVLVERTASGWRAWHLGAEGKRRPAEFQVPSNLAADELCGYLDDLSHEFATADRPAVRRID